MRRSHRGSPRPGDDELDSLAARLGHPADVLAWGRGLEALVVGTRELLAVRRTGPWCLVGWQEVLHGGWDEASATLRWTLLDGTQDAVKLDDPGHLPGVFLERVEASIVVQETITMPDERGRVVVFGRRSPVGGVRIRWLAQPLGATDLADPVVERTVVDATERLRGEFEP